MKNLNRAAGATLMSAAMVFGTGAAAFAHECYSTNRSDQGTKGAGHSAMWHTEDSATPESYSFVFGFVLGVEPTQQMLDEAVQMHLDQGLQRWVSYFQHHTLMQNQGTGEDTPAALMHAGDGRGIDHWSDSELGLGMIAIAETVLANSN